MQEEVPVPPAEWPRPMGGLGFFKNLDRSRSQHITPIPILPGEGEKIRFV